MGSTASGVRISELNRYDVSNLQQTDSLLVPISYNGSTKVISVADIMSLFDNNEQDTAQNEGISENKEAIAYLFSRLQQMAAESNITIQGVVSAQAVTDDVQNTNIASNTAKINTQTNINAAQQREIDSIQTSLSYIQDSLSVGSDIDVVQAQHISENTQKIVEQSQINMNQQTQIDNLQSNIQNAVNEFETINPWGVYTD